MPQDTGVPAAMPEIVIDRTGTPDSRTMIIDSFRRRVRISIDQFRSLLAEGVFERFLTPEKQRVDSSILSLTTTFDESEPWLMRQ